MYDNNVYEKENNDLQCVSNCKDELKYYFLDTDAQVAKFLTYCIQPRKYHDNDNNFCVEKCVYSKRYHKNNFICISESLLIILFNLKKMNVYKIVEIIL